MGGGVGGGGGGRVVVMTVVVVAFRLLRKNRMRIRHLNNCDVF